MRLQMKRSWDLGGSFPEAMLSADSSHMRQYTSSAGMLTSLAMASTPTPPLCTSTKVRSTLDLRKICWI